MGIKEKIEQLIISDLVNTVYPKTKEDVYKYRDENFLSGNYDHLFLKFISDHDLK